MNNLNAKEIAPGIDVTNDGELEKFLKLLLYLYIIQLEHAKWD